MFKCRIFKVLGKDSVQEIAGAYYEKNILQIILIWFDRCHDTFVLITKFLYNKCKIGFVYFYKNVGI